MSKSSKKDEALQKLASKRYFERLIVCMINIITLWCSSLVMASNIVQVFLAFPSMDSAEVSVSDTLSLVEKEKAEYEACAFAYGDLCNLTFQERIEEENMLVSRNQVFNEGILNETREQARSCYAGQKSIYDALSQQPGSFTTKNGSVDGVECSSLWQLSTFNSYNQAVLQSNSDYVASVNDAFRVLESQLRDRLDYDASFLSEKRLKLLSAVAEANILAANRFYQETMLRDKVSRRLNCLLNSSEGEVPCIHPSITELTSAIQNKAFEPLQKNYMRFAALSLEAKSGITDFMASLSRWSQTSGVQILGGMPTFNTKSRLSFIDHYASRKVMDLRENFMAQASRMDAVTQVNLLQVNQVLERFLDFSLTGSIDDQRRFRLLKVLLDGYSPPKVDFGDSLKGLNKATSEFTSSIHQAARSLEKALNTSAALGDEAWSRARESGRRVVEQDLPSISQVQEVLDQPLVNFSFYDVSLDQVRTLWDTMSNCILVGDVLFRLFQTLSLLQKYWRASTTFAPLYDARNVIGIQRGARPTSLQKVALILTHPAFLSICILVFAVVAGTLISLLYAPVYQAYVEGCVLSQPHRHGTAFTQNWETLLTVYASRKGSQELNRVHQTYESWADTVCVQRTTETEAASKLLREELLQHNTNIVMTQKRMQHVGRCFNTPNYLMDTYQETVNSSCSVHHSKLMNDTFDCEGLRTYPLACSGVNQDLIRNSVRGAGCAVERIGHVVAVTYVLSGITFLCLNISRIILMKGIILVYRHRLLPDDSRQILANCSMQGFIVDMDHIACEEYFIKEEAKRKRNGAMLVFLSWCLNIPWLFLAVSCESTLDLGQHAN